MPITKVEKRNLPDSVNMATRFERGVDRVLAKLQEFINSENYYEAHQMYRTLYFRYTVQKKYSQLLDLLYNGATILLQHGQYDSGADLGILYLKALRSSGTEPSEHYFNKITTLFSIMSPSSVDRTVFEVTACKWSTEGTNYRSGHPVLNKKIAHVHWKEKNYIMAKQYFLNSTDGSGYASMLVELHQQCGYSNEIDLFIAQAVLQYLCLKNKATAEEVFNCYTMQHPKINTGPPYLLPLLNFLFFLLKVIDNGQVAMFTKLCERYQISLNRDCDYQEYLFLIEKLFFNIPRPRPRNQGPLGSLLQSILNELDDNDSDEEQRNTASTSHTAQELD